MRHWRAVLAAPALLLAVVVAAAPTATVDQPPSGYLPPEASLHLEAWLPPAPAADSLAQAADLEVYFSTRKLIGTPRAEEAHADDTPPRPAQIVALRFGYLLGVTLTPTNAPKLLAMMERVRRDAEQLLAPVKKSVASGGRHRPFVDYPDLPHCELTSPGLGTTGSFPSGHATVGWLWGSVLAELAPAYADALISRGIAFGDSRVVCGFHYPSDVAAGRLAAAALLDRLHADPAFLRDLAAARQELSAALAAAHRAVRH